MSRLELRVWTNDSRNSFDFEYKYKEDAEKELERIKKAILKGDKIIQVENIFLVVCHITAFSIWNA